MAAASFLANATVVVRRASSCAILATWLSSCATLRPSPVAPPRPSTFASSDSSDAPELAPRQSPGLGRITGVIEGDDGLIRFDRGLTGATVVVTPADGSGALSAITDEKGFYSIANVPPGEYVAAFYYGDASGGQSLFHVTADRATSLFGRIRLKTRPSGWGSMKVPHCWQVTDTYDGYCFP